MQTINPTGDALAQLRALPQDRPIVMLNLLRYHPAASYPPGTDFAACSGAEAYRRYSKTAVVKIAEVGGEVLWMGKALAAVIAPPEERWDEVVLVRYPSPEAFLRMIGMPDYQAATVHRTAALADARLVATAQTTP